MPKQIPFNMPSVVGKEFEYIRDAIQRGQLAGDGYYTLECNRLIEDMTGSPKALLTHSCTAALEMAAILADLGPGDEVILPSYTFVSTANAVVLRGATPVFVDIDPATLNIDPTRIAEAVTRATKAIIVVHYAGFPADMDRVFDIARAHDLIVVEDAAQALGSTYKGRPCGSLGDFGAFSFHETKNIICGEGGALTINRPDLVQRAEIIREKGTNRSQFFRGQFDKYSWVDVGSSYLPGELIASFLLAQLELADMIHQRRMDTYQRYQTAFAQIAMTGRVSTPQAPPDTVGNGHMFYLLLRDHKDRNTFIAYMKARGIQTPFHYVPLHSAPAGERFGRVAGPMTATVQTFEKLVRLPMYFDIGANVENVIEIALAYFDADDMAH